MKHTKRIFLIWCMTILFIFVLEKIENENGCFYVEAHSGKTDSSGGHKDNQNKSGLGSYHYHCGGNTAHLHTNGYCPYDPEDTITINNYSSTMLLGESQEVSYSISSVSSGYGTLTSDNENVISVSGNKLIAKGEGTAVITINSYNSQKQFNIEVKPVLVSNIKVLEEKIDLQVGESKVIDIVIEPDNATNKVLEWKSDNENVVSVSDGKIVALNEGIANIVVKSTNGIEKKIIVTSYIVITEKIETSITTKSTEKTTNSSEDSINVEEESESVESEKTSSSFIVGGLMLSGFVGIVMVKKRKK